MNVNISKRVIILGSIFTVVIIIALSLLLLHEQKQKRIEFVEEFEEQNLIAMEQTKIARKDAEKIMKFINSHLPEGEGTYINYSVPIEMNVEPEYLATYYLEQSLVEEDVSHWISRFTTDASREIMNNLKGVTLEEREAEILLFLKRMSRDGKLETLSCFEGKGNQFILFFKYSDDIEVEVPINFVTLKMSGKSELVINTNILNIIEQIETETVSS